MLPRLKMSGWPVSAAMTTVMALLFASTIRAFNHGTSVPPTTKTTLVVEGHISKVNLKPDLVADGFSRQNGYFLAEMSALAYKEESQVEEFMKGQLGYEHFHWFEFKRQLSGRALLDDIEDTECFVAANDDVLLLVFRGTMGLHDIATDLKLNQIPAPSSWGVKGALHQGFCNGVETVWEEKGVIEEIRKLYNEGGKNRKLLVAGHSMGGALATIAAARLAFEENMNIHGMYTIGSPRVFDGKLASTFNRKMNHGKTLMSKCFRARNNNDTVTLVPYPFYRHVGTEIYFNRAGTICARPPVKELLGELKALLCRSISNRFRDHTCEAYASLFRRAVAASCTAGIAKEL